MRQIWLSLMAAVLIACAAAQDRVGWTTGAPRFIGTSGPYNVRVDVATSEAREIFGELITASNRVVAANTVQLTDRTDPQTVSFDIHFDELLTVGDRYRIRVSLQSGGRVFQQVVSGLRGVMEDVKYASPMNAFTGSSPYRLRLQYTATQRRSIVVALKDPSDTEYLGSARLHVQPGENIVRTVNVHIRGGGGAQLPRGQIAILRTDIRPVDTFATQRYDRVQRVIIAGEPIPSVEDAPAIPGVPKPLSLPRGEAPRTPEPTPMPTPEPPTAPTVDRINVVVSDIVQGEDVTVRISYSSRLPGRELNVFVRNSRKRQLFWRTSRIPEGVGERIYTFRAPQNLQPEDQVRVRATMWRAGEGFGSRVIPNVSVYSTVQPVSSEGEDHTLPPPAPSLPERTFHEFAGDLRTLSASGTTRVTVNYRSLQPNTVLSLMVKAAPGVPPSYFETVNIGTEPGTHTFAVRLLRAARGTSVRVRLSIWPRGRNWTQRLIPGVFVNAVVD